MWTLAAFSGPLGPLRMIMRVPALRVCHGEPAEVFREVAVAAGPQGLEETPATMLLSGSV